MNLIKISDSPPNDGQICLIANSNVGWVLPESLFKDGCFFKREQPHVFGEDSFKQPDGNWGFRVFPTHYSPYPTVEISAEYVEPFDLNKSNFVTPKVSKTPKKSDMVAIINAIVEMITIDNYFVASYGVFDEIYEIPEGYKLHYKSKSSTYWVSPDERFLVRKSDHWGYGIKNCKWFLNGYPKMKSHKWSTQFDGAFKIGIIKFSNMNMIRI
jgi:hypothetical protein